MSERVDFSANAAIYDRRHGAAMPDHGVARLWAAAGCRPGMRMLDVGAGTGRVAIPLAREGARVVAVEPAAAMLKQLCEKDRDRLVRVLAAEGARLPFPSRCFDAVVIARLLYLTPDWCTILDEACRVLDAGGCLLHEWGNGEASEPWVMIREEARRLFEDAGVVAPFHPGVRSEADVDRHLATLRMPRVSDVPIGQGQVIPLREFVRRLVDGELSYIWNVPEQARAECLPVLEQWCERMFDLETAIPIPRQLGWTIYRSAPAIAGETV